MFKKGMRVRAKYAHEVTEVTLTPDKKSTATYDHEINSGDIVTVVAFYPCECGVGLLDVGAKSKSGTMRHWQCGCGNGVRRATTSNVLFNAHWFEPIDGPGDPAPDAGTPLHRSFDTQPGGQTSTSK